MTELQCGESSRSGHTPVRVHDGGVERGFLVALAAGTESVTGWSFNARHRGFLQPGPDGKLHCDAPDGIAILAMAGCSLIRRTRGIQTAKERA